MGIDNRQVGARLRAIMREAEFKTTEAFASYAGAERGTVDAWLNGRSLPPATRLEKLCQDFGVTLDWIYRGDGAGMSLARFIRLQAHLEGLAVPAAASDVPAETLPSAEAEQPRPRTRRKTANGKV